MQKHEHEYYDELCAFAAAGQLSSEEQSQLEEHLKDCEACREARAEFAGIFEKLPFASEARVDKTILRGVDLSGFRRRFLEHAPAEDLRFSESAEQAVAGRNWTLPTFLVQHQWAAASLLLGILLGALGHETLRSSNPPSNPPPASTLATLSPEPRESGRVDAEQKKSIEVQPVEGTYEKSMSALKAENAALSARQTAIESRLSASEEEKQSLQHSLAQTSSLNAELSAKIDQNVQVLAQTRTELEKVRTERESLVSELSAQKTEVNLLSEQVRVQNASLEQERQLLAAGRDITDLMGARSLHMMDVRDADGNGKDRKSFGRIFYTEGKSLIFYAFDLDEKKVVNANYKFEAWGERLGQPSTVKSLGILYADDKAQRRWVLKVDDPREIAQIDSVFVTLEPHDRNGSGPRGKRILYAFLGGVPNHP